MILGGSKTFYTPHIFSVCFLGGLKLFYTPQNCQTESAKFHEILTSVCVEGSKTFYIPPKLLVCVFLGGV